MKIRSHYFPVLTSTWIIGTFVITYLISAFGSKSLLPLFPYISDTGVYPPESAIFGQLLNIGALLIGITLYIRYRQVEFAINTGNVILWRGWNNIAFWMGNIMCLGISIVANFQADLKGNRFILIMHFLGAFLAFGVGALYLTMQIRISYALLPLKKIYPKFSSGMFTIYLRMVLMIFYYGFFISTFYCASAGGKVFDGSDHRFWDETHEGFALHLASAFSEWLLVLMFAIYMMSVTKEFKSLNFEDFKFTTRFIE